LISDVQLKKMKSTTVPAICCGLILIGVHSLYGGENLQKLTHELRVLMDSTKHSVVTVTSQFSQEVSIEKEGGFLSFFKTEYQKRAVSYVQIGTGIIFDRAGHVVTRSSIVVGAENHSVIFHDGEEVPAEFIGADPGTGVAVLKVSHSNLRPAKIGDSDSLLSGDMNVMVGNSFGVFPSFVFGWTNGVRGDGMIQISANLNPGNNGSPVLNIHGEVIGLVAGFMHSPQNGFYRDQLTNTTLAYPSNWIKRIAEDIIQHGEVRRGWLGVVCYHSGSGAKIRDIKENSPAKQAGLKAGDLILNYSGKRVNNISELVRLVEFSAPGDTVALEYLREGEKSKIDITIGEKAKKVSDYAGPASAYGYSRLDDFSEYVTPDDYSAESVNLIEQNKVLEGRIDKLEKEIANLKKLIEPH